MKLGLAKWLQLLHGNIETIPRDTLSPTWLSDQYIDFCAQLPLRYDPDPSKLFLFANLMVVGNTFAHSKCFKATSPARSFDAWIAA